MVSQSTIRVSLDLITVAGLCLVVQCVRGIVTRVIEVLRKRVPTEDVSKAPGYESSETTEKHYAAEARLE
jgi:hypothetical protein